MTIDPAGSPTLDPDSADLSLMQDRQVAVLGYGSVLAAHALNLRDSGVDVRVGLPADGRAAARAEVEGLLVVPPEEAVHHADLIVLPPGEEVREAAELLAAGLEPGDLVLATDPGILRDRGVSVPEGVDLAFLRTIGGPDRLRTEHLDGRGVPALIGVSIDAGGMAWPVLTAYAAALGALRAGAVVVDPDQVADADRFAEVAVHSTIQEVVRTGFTTLVDAGVSPEVAYLACVNEAQERLGAAEDAGWSPGGRSTQTRLSSEQLAAAAARTWEETSTGEQTVRSGADPMGEGRRSARRADAARDPLALVGERVRALMSWVR